MCTDDREYSYYYDYYYNYDGDNGIDYTALDREVSISQNGTGCVDIEVRDDDIGEGPEQFFVTLSASETGIIIQPNSTATVTILDDEEGIHKEPS